MAEPETENEKKSSWLREMLRHAWSSAAVQLVVAAVAVTVVAGINDARIESLLAATAKGAPQLPDVRQLDEKIRARCIKLFLRHRAKIDSRPTVVVFGDSQFFGFACREADKFSALLQQRYPGRQILNLSVIDARLEDIELIARLVRQSGLTVDRCLWGLTLHQLGATAKAGVRRVPEPAWWDLAPWTRLAINPDFQVLSPDRPFYSNSSLETNLYAEIDPDSERFSGAMAALAEIGRPVTVLIPPVAFEDFPAHGYKQPQYLADAQVVLGRVRKAGFAAAQLGEGFSKADFFDMVHLRPVGHARLALALVPFLE